MAWDPARCVEGKADATRLTPRVILVLDGSCSMSTNYPSNGQESSSECTDNPNGRWAALRRALVDPQMGIVPRLQGSVQFGIVTFGTAPRCPIPGQAVRPALNNLAMIESNIPRVQPGMYTPTGPALDWVYDNLIEEDALDTEGGPEIVILATDGEPNSCGGNTGRGGGGGGVMTNYQPSINAVKKGSAKNVTTYVVSLADAAGTFHDHLQELANLGNPKANGSAKLYEPSSPAELSNDLGSLVNAALSCDLAVNGDIAAGTECKGTVTLNGRALGCNQTDGWKRLDARHIRVMGQACNELMGRSAKIEARFPCDTFVPD
jgi:hypothetical protein